MKWRGLQAGKTKISPLGVGGLYEKKRFFKKHGIGIGGVFDARLFETAGSHGKRPA